MNTRRIQRYLFIVLAGAILSTTTRADSYSRICEFGIADLAEGYSQARDYLKQTLWQPVANRLRILTGRGTADLSPEAYPIFHRALSTGNFALEPQEKALLERDGMLARFQNFQNSWSRWNHLNLFVGTAYRSHLTTNRWGAERELEWVSTYNRRLALADAYAKAAKEGKAALSDRQKADVRGLGMEGDLDSFLQKSKDRPAHELTQEALSREWNEGIAANQANLTERLDTAMSWTFILPKLINDPKLRDLEAKLLRDENYAPQAAKQLAEYYRTMLAEISPHYALNSSKPGFDEAGFIKAHQLEREMKRYRDELKLHGPAFARWRLARDLYGSAMRVAILAAMGASLLPTEALTVEQSFDSSNPLGMKEDDDEVEMIYFENLSRDAAIRVGKTTYLFRVTPDEDRPYALPTDHNFPMSVKRFDSIADFAASGIPRGEHTRVQLKLNPGQMAALLEKLEGMDRKVIVPFIPFNSSVAEANRTLRESTGEGLPTGFDRSHRTSIGFFNLMNQLQTGAVKRVIVATDSGKREHSALAAVVDYGEASWMLKRDPRKLLVYGALDYLNPASPWYFPEVTLSEKAKAELRKSEEEAKQLGSGPLPAKLAEELEKANQRAGDRPIRPLPSIDELIEEGSLDGTFKEEK